VVDLDDGTFDQLTRSGAWMIDIYAPGCIHCQKLEPTWRELANALEADGVRVAKIDGTRNRVLLMRFAVEGYPSIFLVRDGQAWQYQGSRTVPALRHFALSGHKASRPLPFHKSPVSAMGRTMGVLHSLPALARRAYAHFKDEKGFSDAAIIGGALAAPLALGGLAICALDAIYTRRAPPGVHDHYE
jgi:thiol-disulfide isomerase/thioredoxin